MYCNSVQVSTSAGCTAMQVLLCACRLGSCVLCVFRQPLVYRYRPALQLCECVVQCVCVHAGERERERERDCVWCLTLCKGSKSDGWRGCIGVYKFNAYDYETECLRSCVRMS